MLSLLDLVLLTAYGFASHATDSQSLDDYKVAIC